MKGKLVSILAFCLCAVALLSACNDEHFSTNPSHSLRFSADTVYMDTLLTRVATSTYQLKVYNRNDEAVRIQEVLLANAANSGFRINVDGMKGSQFNNIELPAKDSLYIFIEATLPELSQNGPVLCKDSIVFLTNGNMQDVKLMAFGMNATTWKGRTLTQDTIISSPALPIVIYDSLIVQKGVSLTVKAGSQFYFHGKAGMRIDGRLITEGTLEQPVVFRGDRTDRMFAHLPYNHLPGQWGGIKISGDSYDNQLNYTNIHGGTYGIICDSASVEQSKITILNSRISQIAGNALQLTDCKGYFANSEFSNAQGDCVRLLGGDCQFIHCTLSNFYSWDMRNGVALAFANHQNELPYPLLNAIFRNCIIAGSTADEISGSPAKDESIPFNYFFSHCLINSIPTEGEQIVSVIWENDDHFKLLDNRTQTYDFRLDSLSKAINIGLLEDAQSYPIDLKGISRLNDEVPDAGCYEWQPSAMTEPQ